MKYKIIFLLFLFSSIIGFSQPISNRSSDVITVQDGNLFAKNSFRPAVFQDTTAGTIALDSCGKLIFTYSDNSYWLRACSPKRWVRLLKEGEAENISNAALTADGDYAQNWNNKQFRVDSIASSLFFRGGGIGSTGTVRKEFSINWPGNSFANQFDQYNLWSAIRKSDNSADSLRLGLLSGGTGSLSMGYYDVANSANNTFISYHNLGLINITAKDSIWIKGATPAATADSILGVLDRLDGRGRMVKIPYGATQLTDSSFIVGGDTIRITGSADPSWQQTLNVGNTTSSTLNYDTTMVGNPVEKLWHKYEPLVKTDTATTAFYDWQFSGSNNGSFNEVRMFGWNLNAGGGQVIAGKPALGEGWESNYQINPAYPASSDRLVEKHEIYVTPAGTQHRIGSYTINTNTGTISLYHTVGSFSLYNVDTHTPYLSAIGTANNTQQTWVNSSDQTEYFSLSTNFEQDASTANFTIGSASGKPTNLFNISNFTLASLPDLYLTGQGYDGSEIRFKGATTNLLGRLAFDSSKTNLTNFTNVPIDIVVDGITTAAIRKTKMGTSVPLEVNVNVNATAPFAALQSSASSASLEAAGWFRHEGTAASNKYGVEISAIGANGTNEAIYINASNATNNRAIRIQFPSAGASNHAIYSDATAQSYFAGKIGIGSGVTAPDSTLQINGSFHNNAGVRMEGLPTGPGTKAVRINANGTLSIADTTIGGGITSLNGLTGVTQAFAVGTGGTDFNISSVTSTHTFNIPDASTANRGLVTTISQTFLGSKTFNTGAVMTFPTANSGTSLVLNGDRTLSAAPGIAGQQLQLAAFTYTDNTGAGTQTGGQHMNSIFATTITSPNARTYSENTATLFISGAPIAAGSITLSHPFAIEANDVSYFQGIANALNEQASTATLAKSAHNIFTGSTATWTLPDLASNPGLIYYIKNAGSGDLIVQRAGSDDMYTTTSVTSITVSAGAAVILVAGTSFWYVE